jgi:1-acyl-sn-glycerol-3-phosphate acyltransferase
MPTDAALPASNTTAPTVPSAVAVPTLPAAPSPVPPEQRWRTPVLWRVALWLAGVLVPVYVRLRVTGDVPDASRRGPMILAGNHISPFDPFALAAASRKRRIAPRMMATGGLFRAPIVGPLMTAAGHIPVDRGRTTVADAVPAALQAIHAGSVVFIYPEGRIGLDPGLWPERAKTGLARLALATRAPVVPVAIWGSHEVIPYHGWRRMLTRGIAVLWRRPTVRVHFGRPVELTDLTEGTVGHAQRASDRIMHAISDELAPLRRDEPRLPRYRDHSRPLSTARSFRRPPPQTDR